MINNEQEINKVKTVLTNIHDKIRYCAYDDVMQVWSKGLINAGIGDKKQAVKEFCDKLKASFYDMEYSAIAIDNKINNLFSEIYGE